MPVVNQQTEQNEVQNIRDYPLSFLCKQKRCTQNVSQYNKYHKNKHKNRRVRNETILIGRLTQERSYYYHLGRKLLTTGTQLVAARYPLL